MWLGGASAALGCSYSQHDKICCGGLKCSTCDQHILRFPMRARNQDADYLFVRTKYAAAELHMVVCVQA